MTQREECTCDNIFVLLTRPFVHRSIQEYTCIHPRFQTKHVMQSSVVPPTSAHSRCFWAGEICCFEVWTYDNPVLFASKSCQMKRSGGITDGSETISPKKEGLKLVENLKIWLLGGLFGAAWCTAAGGSLASFHPISLKKKIQPARVISHTSAHKHCTNIYKNLRNVQFFAPVILSPPIDAMAYIAGTAPWFDMSSQPNPDWPQVMLLGGQVDASDRWWR